jgi:hypothetical protein
MEWATKLNILSSDESIIVQKTIQSAIGLLIELGVIEGKNLEGRKWITIKE